MRNFFPNTNNPKRKTQALPVNYRLQDYQKLVVVALEWMQQYLQYIYQFCHLVQHALPDIKKSQISKNTENGNRIASAIFQNKGKENTIKIIKEKSNLCISPLLHQHICKHHQLRQVDVPLKLPSLPDH